MIEAQRLLESHTMSRHSNDFEKKFSEVGDRADEACDQFESYQRVSHSQNIENSLQGNFQNETKKRTALNLSSTRECREREKISSGASSIHSQNSKNRYKKFSNTESNDTRYSTKELEGESRRDKETTCTQKMYEILFNQFTNFLTIIDISL